MVTLAPYLIIASSLTFIYYFLFKHFHSFFIFRWKKNIHTLEKRFEKDFLRFNIRNVSLFLSPPLIISILILKSSRGIWASTLLLPINSIIFLVSLYIYSGKRKKKVISQLPQFLDLLSNHMRVGHSFPQAIGSVIERVRPPLRDELTIVRGNLTLGLSSEGALLKFHKRLPCEETMILYLAISSSLKRGGNIFEILPIVKESIESKLQAEARVRALTSQGRMQGLTLSIVPPLLFAAFNVVVPGYLHALYSTTSGKWILAISSLLMTLAWISIYIITRPEV